MITIAINYAYENAIISSHDNASAKYYRTTEVIRSSLIYNSAIVDVVLYKYQFLKLLSVR